MSGSAAIPPARRLDGPRRLGQEGGQAKIASGWPPGFDCLSGYCLAPGRAMTASDVQAFLSQHLAADTPWRRRSVPPSLSVPLSQSVEQRWRERPRCPALRVTQAVETGSFTPSLVVSHVAVFAHRPRRRNAPPARTSSCRDSPEECGLQTEQKSVRARRMCSRQKRRFRRCRSRHRTIALFMLTPCSASSMLFATLRPGPGPGLRALTTPPRGMSQATTRWSATCRSLEGGLTRESHGAYVGIITSVPHGTPSVRRHGQRSAHPASAHRARHRAQTLKHHSQLPDNRKRLSARV